MIAYVCEQYRGAAGRTGIKVVVLNWRLFTVTTSATLYYLSVSLELPACSNAFVFDRTLPTRPHWPGWQWCVVVAVLVLTLDLHIFVQWSQDMC